MKKKIRRLKRFLGVSAILLAVLLANIPFPTQAEDDSASTVSGGDTGTGTETATETETETETETTEPVVYDLTVSDQRSELRESSRASVAGELTKNITLQITGTEIENSAGTFPETSGYAARRYVYQKVTLNVTDTDTGNACADYGSMGVTIGLPKKMEQEKGELKVYDLSGTLVSTGSNLGAGNFRVTLNNTAVYNYVFQYYGFITNSVEGNLLKGSASFETPVM